jgi:hypothetical protein
MKHLQKKMIDRFRLHHFLMNKKLHWLKSRQVNLSNKGGWVTVRLVQSVRQALGQVNVNQRKMQIDHLAVFG